MPIPATCPSIRLGFAAIAAVISLSAIADDREIRIGRYQTVTVDAPSKEVEIAPSTQPIVFPDDVTTRGEALEWILQHHGYQLHRETEELVSAAKILAASLPAERRARPVEPLREALESLLGPNGEILIDPGAKQVSLFIGVKAAGDPDGNDRGE